MPNIMNIEEEELKNPEKRKAYTVGIIECNEIGLPYTCFFAEAGFNVIGVATNPHVFRLLKKGKTPFSQKIYRVLKRHLEKGMFTVSSDVRETAFKSDILVIAIPAEIDNKKKPDYTLLEKMCKEIGLGLRKGSLILITSSTGPGVIEGSIKEILEKASGFKAGADFGLAYSPTQMSSMVKLDNTTRIVRVLGAINYSTLRMASNILSTITKAEILKVSNIKTAETINLLKVLQGETNMAFANEFAFLCERLGVDFFEILEVANKDKTLHLSLPGIANVFARRDFYLLEEEAENVKSDLRLTRLARKINDEIIHYTYHLIKESLKECRKTVRRAKISVLGVSRYPNTKELPDSLIKNIISFLQKKVKKVQIYDPFFSKEEINELGFESEKLSETVEKTDCLLILVGHSKFKRLNLNRIKFLAKKSPAIIDISMIIDPQKAKKHGFVYRGLGRRGWD